ncbi:MAG TPA: hypothetical protein VFX49_19635, partial [Chloroflexota bacterium]|nr:hypothetical protein [Chloroflexota bacterium]
LPAAPVAAGALAPAHAGRATPPAVEADTLVTVLSYVRELRPDDALVEVRAGVFAKRSNVSGVRVSGRTLYYDMFPHQSFGPLATGRWSGYDVTEAARNAQAGAVVVVYEHR